MELSPECLEGLQLAGDSAHVPDDSFTTIVDKTCQTLLNQQAKNCILGEYVN